MVGKQASPATDPSEYQHWIDPILCEEACARLQYFRQLGWLPPNYKPKTLTGIAVVENTSVGRSASHSYANSY
jgi:hypothetical protein